MSDLVQTARARTHVDGRTHYDGCEREHVECLVQMMASEIEQLRADARRYRYLRDNLLHGVAHPMGDAIGMSEVIFGDDPDAAIDAEMRAREGDTYDSDTYDYEADDQAFDAAREDRVFVKVRRAALEEAAQVCELEAAKNDSYSTANRQSQRCAKLIRTLIEEIKDES